MKTYQKYAEDILSGRVVTGEYMKLTAERHFRDIDRAANGDIPYFFHEGYADHVISFVRKMKHSKGKMANKNFDLQPFQEFLLAMTFGWLGPHEDTGDIVRRFTKVYNEVARKNGKTELLAAVGNYGLLSDAEHGAEIYSAATKISQARIVFDASKSMLRKFKRENKFLSPDLSLQKDNISYLITESKYEPLPADADTLDGSNPHYALIDELHAHRDSKLFKVLETGMGARTQPLMLIITTAGFNINGICYKVRKTNIDILKGIKQDDRSLSLIYCLDEDDDWHEQDNWVKANPNIGKSVYWQYLKDQYQKALTEGTEAEFEFLTKNLNKWMSSGATWIRDDVWKKSGTEWNEEMLLGRTCHIGMDLSSVIDLTCLAYVFPPSDNDPKYRVLCRFYCPEENIEKRSKVDKVDYREWVKAKKLTATPGETVDYDYLLRDLKEDLQRYNVASLDYDTAMSHKIVAKIKNMGIECRPYGQNCKDMNAPIREIEKLIIDKRLDHANNPVLRWNVSNVLLYTDTNGKVKFNKSKAIEKIDGCVALAMAMGGYLTNPMQGRSKYESQELSGV